MEHSRGGHWNVASGNQSTVAGGINSTASGDHATVGGGDDNTASGSESTIGGGWGNTVSGSFGVVGGGNLNFVGGSYSVIPGGLSDTLTSSAEKVMVFGRGVYVSNPYRVVFFDSAYSGRLGINRDDHDGGINHPIHVGTDASNGNGAYLSADGQWHDASSKNLKTDFQALAGKEILTQISKLPVESWRYKGTRGLHIGPYAEDFVQAFGVGTLREDGTLDNRYLAPSDLAGVALVGVKELVRENQEFKQIIDELKQRITELEKAK